MTTGDGVVIVRGEDGGHFKDSGLDAVAERGNVAQFVSFGPGAEPALRFARLRGYPRNFRFASIRDAVATLLSCAPESLVNVRSFDPGAVEGNEFLYGIQGVDRAVAEVVRLASSGLYTIVNETIDVKDGGVSGVAYAGVLEFAPGDTPRCVEKPGTATFSLELGLRVLETVYGFRPSFENSNDTRVEFSIHPLRRGVRGEHTIIWEVRRLPGLRLSARTTWPNHFSRLLGDKAFGLLLAAVRGLSVPSSLVVPREVAPFRFGQSTGTGEQWIRTSPREPTPGRFTTHRGWLDPYLLMDKEDRAGTAISSVLAQEGVASAYSGALITSVRGEVVIEGVQGTGEAFMMGTAPPEPLPARVREDVMAAWRQASGDFGPTRMEWAHDGQRVWVLQLHQGAAESENTVVFPGPARTYHRFDVSDGLDALRALAVELRDSGDGIVLVGKVGVTSHFGDVLRKAHIPSMLESSGTNQ